MYCLNVLSNILEICTLLIPKWIQLIQNYFFLILDENVTKNNAMLNEASFQRHCYLAGVRITLIQVYVNRIEFRYFFHILGFLLKMWLSYCCLFCSFLVLIKSWGKQNNPNSCVPVSIFLALNSSHLLYTHLETWYLEAPGPLKTVSWTSMVLSLRISKPCEPHTPTRDEGDLHFSQVFLFVTKDELSLREDSSASFFWWLLFQGLLSLISLPKWTV